MMSSARRREASGNVWSSSTYKNRIRNRDNDCERLKERILTCAGEKERPCIDVMNYVWLRQPDDISSTRNVPSSFSKWLSSRNAG
jgi:hypothetical protein